MLQNARFTAFTISELLRENQLGGKITPPLPLTQIRVKPESIIFYISPEESPWKIMENAFYFT